MTYYFFDVFLDALLITSIQSVCLAVGFTSDGMTGFAGAGSNGVGAQIIKSTDGGVTWAAPGNQSASFNIYLDAKAESRYELSLCIPLLLHFMDFMDE